MTDSFIEKNLQQLKENQPDFVQKMLEYDYSSDASFEFMNTESNHANLTYKNIPLHSQINPEEEAKEEFSKVEANITPSTTIILFGLGLGYYLKHIIDATDNPIVVYEPDLNLLKFFFEVVDFSDDLSKKRVSFATNLDELETAVSKIFISGGNIVLARLKSADILNPQELINLSKELPFLINRQQSNYSTLFAHSYEWLFHGLVNVFATKHYNNLDCLKNKFNNKAALVVSPGPSLDKTIETIKQNRQKFVIFCANTAAKKLYKNEITPDFIVFIDTYSTMPAVEGLDLSNTNMINLSVAFSEILSIPAHKKFIHFTKNDLVSRWAAKTVNMPIEEYESKGTVSYCALSSAYIMGCNPIILTGQDLAYSGGKIYSSGSAYGDIYECKVNSEGKAQIQIQGDADSTNETAKAAIEKKMQNDNLMFVKGQNGSMLPTNAGFANFIKYFEEFAITHKNSRLVNCSQGGALIKGFENLDFDSLTKELPEIALNINEELDKITEAYDEPVKVNYEKFKDAVRLIKNDISKNLPAIKKASDDSIELKKELNRLHPNLNKVNKLTSNIITTYQNIHENLFLKHEILINMVFKELMEFGILMDEKDFLKNTESFKKIAEKGYELFSLILSRKNKINEIFDVILIW